MNLNKNNDNIIFYTRVYNGEETLSRCVDSILNQTISNFKYYLVDNGSTDKTRKIINRYSKNNEHIIPIYYDENRPGRLFDILDTVLDKHSNGYLCTLDADDEYAPDFLEKMLAFIQKYNLEVAACGNDFIDAQTKKLIGVRKLGKNLVLEGAGFNKHFRTYHQFMRTIWGKVYSLSVLRRYNIYNTKKNISYGSDTLFAMEAFRNASRVGILAKSLHKYYISPKSDSYMFNEKRIASDQVLFDAACDFLISKSGEVSDENRSFLRLVYLNAIKDTLNVLLNAQISVSDKLAYLLDIFQSRHTQELIKWTEAGPQKRQLFSQVAAWVLSKKEVRSGSGLDIAANILAAMDIYPSQIDGWQDGWLFMLLAKIRDRQIEMGFSRLPDSHIVSVTATSPYLVGSDAGYLCYFRDIVFSILQNDDNKALNQIEELIAQEIDIPGKYIEDFLTLALNLSAKLEYPDYFVYFKKLQISLLIDLSRVDEAVEEFADWDEILSDDTDFKELKERLGK